MTCPVIDVVHISILPEENRKLCPALWFYYLSCVGMLFLSNLRLRTLQLSCVREHGGTDGAILSSYRSVLPGAVSARRRPLRWLDRTVPGLEEHQHFLSVIVLLHLCNREILELIHRLRNEVEIRIELPF